MKKVNWSQALNAGFAILCTCFHFLFGGWTAPLIALIVLTIFDFLLGTFAALRNKEYNSRIGKWGVYRKIFYLSAVVVARMIDILTGMPHPVWQTLVIYGLAGHELGSFIENADKAGFWVPAALKKAMAQLKKEGGEEDEPG